MPEGLCVNIPTIHDSNIVQICLHRENILLIVFVLTVVADNTPDKLMLQLHPTLTAHLMGINAAHLSVQLVWSNAEHSLRKMNHNRMWGSSTCAVINLSYCRC